MNVKPNIGIINALIRITAGLTILTWCTAKLVKRPWGDSYLFVAICAAMKVAEGIVRYCPMTAFFEKCQQMPQQSSGEQDSLDGMEGLTDDVFTDNPS